MTTAAHTPYLSVVVTCRNDDHGGSPVTRLQAFVNSFNAQCRRTGLDAEVIVVDWNPPGDRPPLARAIRWPADLACTFRFVEVPPAVHATLRFADKMPLFQMIAKNVGIRRAAGRFVLSTNIDIIFADELVDYFSAGRLESGILYRVNRHDIEADFPVDGTPSEQMAYCRSHQLRLHRKWGSYPIEPDGSLRALPGDIVKAPGVRLGDGWHVREGRGTASPIRWASRRAEVIVDRELHEGDTLEIDVESHPGGVDSYVALKIVDPTGVSFEPVVRGRRTLAVKATSNGPYVLEVLDAPDLRSELPVYENRDNLLYRVHAIRLQPESQPIAAAGVPIPLASLTAAAAGIELIREPGGNLVVKTLPGRTYAVRWRGVAPVSGTFEFQIDYRVREGDISLGALSGSGQRWLANVTGEPWGREERSLVLAVPLTRAEPFQLMVSNNPRDDAARSDVAIHRVLIRGPRAEVMRAGGEGDDDHPGIAETLSRQWHRVLIAMYDRLARRLPAALTDVVVNQAEKFKRLEEQCTDLARRSDTYARRANELSQLEVLAPHGEFVRRYRPDCLHLNACGDFQLMAREHWFELQGFAEVQTYSMNVDGLFCYVAFYAGIRERVFEEPMCIYHLEHETGSGFTPEGEQLLRRRMDDRGIPWVEWTTVATWASYMRWLQQPLIFGCGEWGFGDITLDEQTVPASVGSRRS